MTTENNDDYVVIWEAPKIEPPEFRLYYDDKGNVVTYTCEKLPGTFIIIDAATFAEARHDLRIIDGKISRVQPNFVVYKLMPNKNEGVRCASEDINIIVGDDYTGDTIKWKLNIYELQ